MTNILNSISTGFAIIALLSGLAWFFVWQYAKLTKRAIVNDHLKAEMECQKSIQGQLDANSSPQFVTQSTQDQAQFESHGNTEKPGDSAESIQTLEKRIDQIQRRMYERMKILEGKMVYKGTIESRVVGSIAGLAAFIAIATRLALFLMR